ncbi:MAG: FAD-binding oxidoreductase [Anaerolineaceae bacterium]
MRLQPHTHADEIQPFLTDESSAAGQAEGMFFPQNEEEIREALQFCRENNAPVTVQGARTGITGGAVPSGGQVINLSRCSRALGMSWEEDTQRFSLTVQPGMLFSQIQKGLAEKEFNTGGWSADSLRAYRRFCADGRWYFPADITETSASIGGMVSTNASGAKSYRYGPMRAHVTGLRLLLADGRFVQLRRGEQYARGGAFRLRLEDGSFLSGKLPSYRMPNVKNASGYYITPDMDLLDLFIGAEGTLGIVTEISIALARLPALSWGILSFFEESAHALRYVQSLKRLQEEQKPAAIEYFDRACLEMIRREQVETHAHQGLPLLPAAEAVYTEFHHAAQADMDLCIRQTAGLLENAGANLAETWLAVTPQDLDKLIGFRHALPESINRVIAERKRENPALTKLGTDMAVPDKKLEWVHGLYSESLGALRLQGLKFGHIGDNHLHVNILPRSEQEYQQGKVLFLDWARRVIDAGGTVSAEHGIGKLKTAQLLAMYGEQAVEEMRALKRCFDPLGLLNPGNMFAREGGG